ncbi:MAG: DNA-binding protein [Desulfobacterales bacterium]|nr:DNA-binding protein [Desulfobacterales bacterium]MCP4160764.1 DNA-binding protein [Deltaproteobacteria bacterium]
MIFSEAKTGRTFVIRLEDGDVIHEKIEEFAKENNIRAAYFNALGGVDKGSILITGPVEGRGDSVVPMYYTLEEVFEAQGTGTLIPEENSDSTVHMHLSCGRKEKTITGCIRSGVKVWHVMEIVLTELLESSAMRKPDKVTGFNLLIP